MSSLKVNPTDGSPALIMWTDVLRRKVYSCKQCFHGSTQFSNDLVSRVIIGVISLLNGVLMRTLLITLITMSLEPVCKAYNSLNSVCQSNLVLGSRKTLAHSFRGLCSLTFSPVPRYLLSLQAPEWEFWLPSLLTFGIVFNLELACYTTKHSRCSSCINIPNIVVTIIPRLLESFFYLSRMIEETIIYFRNYCLTNRLLYMLPYDLHSWLKCIIFWDFVWPVLDYLEP